jgi:Na+-driven multidrug efflux pump
MGVSLYTSRIVLDILGVNDYGLYTIVGGIVTLFSFFNGAMSSATQRFLSFDIGRNDLDQLKKTFNATLNIHIAIGILVMILAETLGLWFVNNKLNLPLNRMNAVNWVYQFSVFTFLLGIVQVPYDALIMAREKMNIYAYMSIIEVFLKLIIVYLLLFLEFDKLIIYTGLLFLVSFIVRLAHKMYCKFSFEESKYQFYFEKKLYIKLVSYSGWNLFGNIAAVARSQGLNVILNLFFGTILNAAYGITLQVQSAINVFVLNFQMAVNPQIIKNYAKGDFDESKKLISQSSKFSYFLMFLIVCPVLINIDFILSVWLTNVPKYTPLFIQLCLVNLLVDCISGPLMIGAQANGNIKWYQIVVGSLVFLNLPLAYVLLKIYNQPELIYYCSIFISIISLFFRLYFIQSCLGFSVKLFLKQILGKIILVTTTVIFSFSFLDKMLYFDNSWFLFITRVFLIEFIIIFSIFLIGISKKERILIYRIIFKNIN